MKQKFFEKMVIITTTGDMRVVLCGNRRCDNIIGQFGHVIYCLSKFLLLFFVKIERKIRKKSEMKVY